MDTWTILDTDFLAPPVVWAASSALDNIAGLAVRAWGGYPQVLSSKLFSTCRRTFFARRPGCVLLDMLCLRRGFMMPPDK